MLAARLKKLAVLCVLSLLLLGGLEFYLDYTDETRGIESAHHPLHGQLITVIADTLGITYSSAEVLVTQSFLVSRIETRATPWYDKAALVEATGLVQSYGMFQIHWRTALSTARRYWSSSLETFLGNPLPSPDASKATVLRNLQLRGRGSVVLAILYIATLREHLSLTQSTNPEILTIKTAAVLRACGPGLDRYGQDSGAIRDFVAESLDRRRRVHLMCEYAAGDGTSMGADIQAMVNESLIVQRPFNQRLENSLELLVVDGDPGPRTWQVLETVAGIPVPTGRPTNQELSAIHGRVREWYANLVEPLLLRRIYETTQLPIVIENGPFIQTLQNRYAGHVAYFTALAEMARQVEVRDAQAGQRVRRELNRRFRAWALKRDPRFWQLLADEDDFDRLFSTGLVHQQTLICLTAKLFLLHRLVSRELGGEVGLTYRHHWIWPDVNPLGRILLLAEERGWLIDE